MLSIDNVLLTPGNLCRAAILAKSRKIIVFSCFFFVFVFHLFASNLKRRVVRTRREAEATDFETT